MHPATPGLPGSSPPGDRPLRRALRPGHPSRILSDPGSLTLARQVLEQLAGHPLPASWNDATCALKGTGRLPLTPADRSALGPAARTLPLFG